LSEVGRPSAIVAQYANNWTLAHEVGHVLDLKHVYDDKNRLMFGDGTAQITNLPPDLTAEEGAKMIASVFTVPV
jgi:hypothetical protein